VLGPVRVLDANGTLVSAVHLVGAVASLHPEGYAALPALLRPGEPAGVVVVHGYPQTAGRYLPGRHVVGPGVLRSGAPVAAVVVDPAMDLRAPDPALDRWLAANTTRYTAVHTAR
jgi:hypothetical protein